MSKFKADVLASVYSVTWSFRNPSNMLIINVENSCAASYLCGNRDAVFVLNKSIHFIFFFITDSNFALLIAYICPNFFCRAIDIYHAQFSKIIKTGIK